jgi:[citrate (pro-3S)-lyase] ligase
MVPNEEMYNQQLNLMKLISDCAAGGKTIFDCFKENDISSISIFGVDYLGVILYEAAIHAQFPVNMLLSDIDREFSTTLPEPQKLQFQSLSKITDTKKLGFILAASSWNKAIIDLLSEHKLRFFMLDAFLEHLYMKIFFLDKLDIFHEKNPFIKIILCHHPHLNQIGGEKSNIEETIEKDNIWFEDKNEMREIYKKYNFDDNYIENITTTPLAIASNAKGIYRYVDYQSEYVNIVNGYRVTTDIPERYDGTIYTFGDSVCGGLGIHDAKTIASALQRQINTYFTESELPFSVVNAANTAGKTWEHIFSLLEDTHFNQNDIIIFILHFDYLSTVQKNKFLFCNLSTLFQRPHEFEEVFIDMTHFSHNGNEAIAKKLFETMRDAGYLKRDRRVSPPSPSHNKVTPAAEKKNLFPKKYTAELEKYKQLLLEHKISATSIGAIVMNCNPFTLGHRYLIEYAAQKVNHLFIFAVEENKSIFPFSDRFELIKAGTTDLQNVTVLPSGKFIISSLTFTDYFNKSEMQDRVIDPSADVTLFAEEIAPTLGITVCFAGEEPLDNVTRQYNDAMKRILPQHGIEFVVIPRKEFEDEPISASRVRALLKEKNFDEIAKIVPETTLEYLRERYGGKST